MQDAPPIRTGVEPGQIPGYGLPSVPGVAAGPGASLRPLGIVPGTVIPRPGAPLSSKGRKNKSGQSSNEPIVTTIIVEPWLTQHYEQRQQPGDILFIRSTASGNGKTFPTLNVAQLNEILRNSYLRLQEIRGSVNAASQQRAAGNLEPVPENTSNVSELYERMHSVGEALLDDEANWTKISTNRTFSAFIGVSLKLIMYCYRFVGLYASDGGRYAKPHLTYNVIVGGPTTYQEAFNIWGTLTEGYNVGLILTRRRDPTGRANSYAEFYLKPWQGHEDYPPNDEDTAYYDEAGIKHYGRYIPVGYVYRTPLEPADPAEQRDRKAGLLANSVDADQTRVSTVALVIGPRRVCRDLFLF